MGVLRIGSSGASVRQLQQRLQDSGYDPGSVDGVYGADTAAAVRAFQEDSGLQVDGEAGAQVTRALHLHQTDGFDPAPVVAPAPRAAAGGNLTATFDAVQRVGASNQMVSGRITVNGTSYEFRSGGHGRGSLPPGSYEVTAHRWSRGDRTMNVGGVGYSFALSNAFDPRVGRTRTELRIHPDGGSAGTEGCIGIVGDAAVQRRFRDDMRAELGRNGGSFTLQVG